MELLYILNIYMFVQQTFAYILINLTVPYLDSVTQLHRQFLLSSTYFCQEFWNHAECIMWILWNLEVCFGRDDKSVS